MDRNTYEIFGLEDGVPTFYYKLEQAVKEGYLVSYTTREVRLKFPEEGIRYDLLSPEEKERFEKIFAVEDGEDYVPPSAINNWFLNVDTIDIVLNELMDRGIRDESGNDVGKTIVFAANQRHTELIKERFDHLYAYKGSYYADVITHKSSYAQDLIDRFSVKQKMPRIAISVNMLDTGIDVPEVVNLVFFKKVLSKTMFWQMVGRGTRLCPDLFGPGKDKEKFLILDYGGNMERFDAPLPPSTDSLPASLTERFYSAKADLIYGLEHGTFKGHEVRLLRAELVDEWIKALSDLNTQLVAVRQSLKEVLRFREQVSWESLSRQDLSILQNDLAPLIHGSREDIKIQRFDLAMTILAGKGALGERDEYREKRVKEWIQELLKKQDSLPMVRDRFFELKQLLEEGFWEKSSPIAIDEMRKTLRDLMPLLSDGSRRQNMKGNFIDDILEAKDGGPIYGTGQFESYRAKVEHHIRSQIEDDSVVNKIYNNLPLDGADVAHLEEILWHDLGTKEDYDEAFDGFSILRLIRKINGLSPDAVQQAFADFLLHHDLSLDQSQFVQMIMHYYERNGFLELVELSEEPFRSLGSVGRIFEDDRQALHSIVDIIERLNGKLA